MPGKRPNFLFIITDQQRADHLGCYGNPVVRTPHIDGIAARGCRFDRFYVAAPVCQPNRNTIMTGRMPTLHGTRQNGIPLALDATCFTHLLRHAGYRTGLFGKAHFQNFTGEPPRFALTFPEHLTAPPADRREAVRGLRVGPAYDRELNAEHRDPRADEAEGDFYGFERFRLCTWHGDDVRGHYMRWLEARLPGSDALRSAVDPRPAPGYDAPQVRWSRIPEELYPSAYVADETIAFLEERAADPARAPFFAQCSFPDPHHPFTPPGRYFHMVDPASIELPASFHHAPHDQTPMLRRLHEEFAAGTADRRWVAPYAVDAAEARQIIAVTYGMIACIDDAVGRVLARLDALGLAEDTVVIFTSDHGDWMGDHGIMQKGPLHYQGLIRVPFLWADPHADARGTRCAELAGSIDIAKSILERAGVAPANGMQGQAVGELAAGAGRSAHDCMIVEQQTSRPYLGMTRQVRIRTMTDGRWRLSVWEGQPFGELYDLENDPGEIVNLWADPGHLGTRRALAERMLWQMIALQDRSPFQVGEA
ncbi:MAG: sulfatase-like hydrolase/transferase [Burkholderiales bacterium]|nr:sulfatase-like hydrolase/transferase [Burkholderiales bacterium]